MPTDPPSRDRGRGRRPFPDDAQPEGLPHPEPDPLDEPDDLLVGEDEDEPAESDSPEPEPSPWEAESAEDEPSDLSQPGEEPPGDPDLDADQALLEDEDADDADSAGDEPEASPWDEDALLEDEASVDEPTPALEQPFAWEDPEEDPQREDLDDQAWAELEDESVGLPRGRRLVGLQEWASMPALELHGLVARFDTGRARSALYAGVESHGDGTATLHLPQHSVRVGLDEAGRLQAQVAVAGAALDLLLDVVDAPADVALVLGRDAMEGVFVVDVGVSFLRPRPDGD